MCRFVQHCQVSDWTSQLETVERESPPTPPSHHWREVFAYDELNDNNRDVSIWEEIHRPWALVMAPMIKKLKEEPDP